MKKEVTRYLSEIGKKGGKLGGPARAKKLGPKRVKEIAKKASDAAAAKRKEPK